MYSNIVQKQVLELSSPYFYVSYKREDIIIGIQTIKIQIKVYVENIIKLSLQIYAILQIQTLHKPQKVVHDIF